MHRIKNWREVGLDNSYMFRLVMENKELCQPFIERVLDIKITKLIINQPESSIENSLETRGIRMDIYAEDDQGTAYDLEMQTVNIKQWDLAKRVRYYQSAMDSKALKKSSNYDQLRQSYIIFICTFDPFGLNLGKYSFKETCLEATAGELILDNGSTHVFINTTGNTKNLSIDLQNVIKYISSGSVADDYTRNLHFSVVENRNDVDKERAYMTVEEYARDVGKHMAEEAHKEGIIIGRKEGLLEGGQLKEKEIIANMLKDGMSEEDILRIVPDATYELIESIKNQK